MVGQISARTSFEPASVMEFDFNTLATGVVGLQISLCQGSKAPKQEGELNGRGRQDYIGTAILHIWNSHHEPECLKITAGNSPYFQSDHSTSPVLNCRSKYTIFVK